MHQPCGEGMSENSDRMLTGSLVMVRRLERALVAAVGQCCFAATFM